jgi:hypothetical protein
MTREVSVLAYRAPSSDDHTPCASCGTTVAVKDTVYSAGGDLLCNDCDARAKTATHEDGAHTRGKRLELLLGLAAPPFAFPAVWGACRIVLGLLDASDVEVAAFSIAALLWVLGLALLATLALVKWRRRWLGFGLIGSLVAMLVVAGALALMLAMAMAGAIRG